MNCPFISGRWRPIQVAVVLFVLVTATIFLRRTRFRLEFVCWILPIEQASDGWTSRVMKTAAMGSTMVSDGQGFRVVHHPSVLEKPTSEPQIPELLAYAVVCVWFRTWWKRGQLCQAFDIEPFLMGAIPGVL